MDLKILNDRMRELKKELEDIRAKLEEAEKEQQKSRRWKPQVGEIYYFVNGFGEIIKEVWKDHPTDMARYAIGNCQPTFKDCIFEFEREKVIAEMREFEERPNYEWNKLNWHYFICYDFDSHTLNYLNRCSNVKSNDIYFESEDIARACIDKVGEERIREYYCRVKEG